MILHWSYVCVVFSDFQYKGDQAAQRAAWYWTVAMKKANNIQGYSSYNWAFVLIVYLDYAMWLLQMVVHLASLPA